MADYSNAPPPPPPMMGLHTGRIPSFKNNHGENFQNKCGAEPPACVQNAMMTKDKKPFTYTPGGLDLSQIRTPSMARRLNKQQQMEDHDNNYAQYRPPAQPSYNGGGPPYGSAMPPPPPPPPPSGPPPPPALVINVNKPVKPIPEGERPEIVIPDNPISMLRKTHSPYHWESEMADRLSQGPVPKFVEKSPTHSPIPPPQLRPTPQQFSQRPPSSQTYEPPPPPPQQTNMNAVSTSPIWKPEPKYPQNNSVNSPSPQMYYQPSSVGSTPSNEMFNRQDSRFNSTPSPWANDSNTTSTTTTSSSTGFTPSTDTSSTKSTTPISSPASPWRQEARNSPMRQDVRSPMSPNNNQDYRNSPARNIASPMSPINNNKSQIQSPPTYPPFYNSNRQESQQQSVPPWRMGNQVNNVQQQQRQTPQPVTNQAPTFVKSPSPQKQVQFSREDPNAEVRYQTHMTIPVTPRKMRNPNEQSPPIQSNNEPYYNVKTAETPKDTLPWVRGENTINKSAPPPPWCQKAMESRRSAPRDSEQSPEVSSPAQPPWCAKPSENRRSVPKDSPNSANVQPPWVTQNRGYDTLPRSQNEKMQSMPAMDTEIHQHTQQNGQPRIIPIHMEGVQPQNQSRLQGKHQPSLRIIIDMNQPGQPQAQIQTPQGNNVPQHRIRMIQPQLVRMDGASLSTPPVQEQNNVQPPFRQQQQQQQQQQPKTRIIPIQMEPSSPVVTSPRVIYHKVSSDLAPRQSKSFKVLQIITGTDEGDDSIENQCGYSDL